MFKRNAKTYLVVLLTLSAVTFSNAQNLVTNPSFETAETTSGGWPYIYGDWNGDYSAIVGPTSGINPLDGSNMPKFKGTSFSGCASSNSCQLYQLVDIASYEEMIASGNTTATASAYFTA